MIICVTGNFPIYDRNGYPTGEKEFLVSHGIDYHMGQTVILPCVHPQALGAVYSKTLGEWVLLDRDESLEDYAVV